MYNAREEVLSARVARAERLLEDQRLRVHRLRACGLNASAALALLHLMESVTEQFRTAWRLIRAYPQPLKIAVDGRQSTRPLAPVAGIAEPLLPPGSGSGIVHGQPARQPTRRNAIFSCPHCGLPLGLGDGNGSVVYSVYQWTRRCRYLTLQSAGLCQLLPGPAAALQ
jgi:hypothetical protein